MKEMANTTLSSFLDLGQFKPKSIKLRSYLMEKVLLLKSLKTFSRKGSLSSNAYFFFHLLPFIGLFNLS